MPYDIPARWTRSGVILPRAASGPGSAIVGDPSVVWDEEIGAWRMFCVMAPPGHGQAVSRGQDAGPGQWRALGPLSFVNPGALAGGEPEKPFIVMDAEHPNQAARVDGRLWLLIVSPGASGKVVQRAWSEHLAGPWTIEPGALIPPGVPDAFDAKHTDAPTGLYFAGRREFLYFYMGYPRLPQPRSGSPLGSAQGVAVQRLGESGVKKLGVVLPPAAEPGHWAAGWVGGLHPVPGRRHRWIAVVNASPTPPDPADQSISREEPPPSLGGFAMCDAEWPVDGWRWCPEPLEWISDIDPQAVAAGEGVNLWRHHLLAMSDGRLALLYNSGAYGNEQIYMKVSSEPVGTPGPAPAAG